MQVARQWNQPRGRSACIQVDESLDDTFSDEPKNTRSDQVRGYCYVVSGVDIIRLVVVSCRPY